MNKTETRKIIEQELEKATGPSNSDIQPNEEALLVVPAEEEKTFSMNRLSETKIRIHCILTD